MLPLDFRDFCRRQVALLFLTLAVLPALNAQHPGEEREASLFRLLDSLAYEIPGLNEITEMEFRDAPLGDFLRTVGKAHRINLFVDSLPDLLLSHSFSALPVKEVLAFICLRYRLEIRPTASILLIRPIHSKPPEPPPDPSPDIRFESGKLSFSLHQDPFRLVIRKVSEKTGLTLVPLDGQEGYLSGYVPPQEAFSALQSLFWMNGFVVENPEAGRMLIRKMDPVRPPTAQNDALPGNMVFRQGEMLRLRGENLPLGSAIREICRMGGWNYLIRDKLEGQLTVDIQSADPGELLAQALEGTGYTIRISEQLAVIGASSGESFREVRMRSLLNRPAAQIPELLPGGIRQDVDIKVLPGLNCLFLEGESTQLAKLESLIDQLDQPVPMVRIEMVVLDVDVNRLIETGVQAGIAGPADSISGSSTFFPGLDLTLDGNALGQILSASGIPFLTSIGPISPNFFIKIQAQESSGNLRVLTRPVISALNGETASMTIGETRFFKLKTNLTPSGGLNPVTTTTEQIQEFAYNTTIRLTPFVAANGLITLDIRPDFTAPGSQPDPDIPPSILTRSFESRIRVREGETVVLGGLSREALQEQSSGLPVLSRIPVLKWIFGSRSRQKSRSTLLIYLTPYVRYE